MPTSRPTPDPAADRPSCRSRRQCFRAISINTVLANTTIWLGRIGTAWQIAGLKPTPVMVTLMQAAMNPPVFLFALPADDVGNPWARASATSGLVALEIATTRQRPAEEGLEFPGATP